MVGFSVSSWSAELACSLAPSLARERESKAGHYHSACASGSEISGSHSVAVAHVRHFELLEESVCVCVHVHTRFPATCLNVPIVCCVLWNIAEAWSRRIFSPKGTCSCECGGHGWLIELRCRAQGFGKSVQEICSACLNVG